MNDKKRIIAVDNAPKAIGPYSQGIAIDGLLFLSGQIAIDPLTKKLVEGNISDQTEQVIKNIDNLLKSEGLTNENVIKTTVFITDMSKFSDVNLVYGRYFSSNPPARSCIEISGLPLNALVEIEVIAKR